MLKTIQQNSQTRCRSDSVNFVYNTYFLRLSFSTALADVSEIKATLHLHIFSVLATSIQIPSICSPFLLYWLFYGNPLDLDSAIYSISCGENNRIMPIKAMLSISCSLL